MFADGRCIIVLRCSDRRVGHNLCIFVSFSHVHAHLSDNFLLDEFLCFEEPAQVEDLPRSQTQETAHAEYTEEQDTAVGRFWWKNKRDIFNTFFRLEFPVNSPLVLRISSSRLRMAAKS